MNSRKCEKFSLYVHNIAIATAFITETTVAPHAAIRSLSHKIVSYTENIYKVSNSGYDTSLHLKHFTSTFRINRDMGLSPQFQKNYQFKSRRDIPIQPMLFLHTTATILYGTNVWLSLCIVMDLEWIYLSSII
uniref:Uncharacterized protein n=1 Tax=Glossina austeni TaxID=7395 RepID=A0A1A9V0W0_GLOAU